MADCPSCISFKGECNPEPEDYNEPCEYYKNVWVSEEEDLEVERRAAKKNRIKLVYFSIKKFLEKRRSI